MGPAYDPEQRLQVHVVSQSPHTFAYKLWLARPGDTTWTALDTGTIDTPEKEYGPFEKRTRFAYTLLVAGNPNTEWKVQVLLSQSRELLACSPPPEEGITNARGIARRDAVVVLQ